MPRTAAAGARRPPPSDLGRALVERLEALLLEREGVHCGRDGEAVHRMRVASRRLREALRIAEPGKRLRREARRVTRGLGDLREAQVTANLFEVAARGAAGAETQGFDYLLLDAQRRVRRAERRARRRLAKVDLGDLERRVRELAGSRRALPAGPLDSLLPPARAADELLAVARESPSAESLHRLRIGVKRLRYAVEIVGAGRRAALVLAAALKQLQDALGEHHDLVVAVRHAERVRARLAGSRRVALAAAVAAAAERVRGGERKALARVARRLERWPRGAFVRRARRLALGLRAGGRLVVGTRALSAR